MPDSVTSDSAMDCEIVARIQLWPAAHHLPNQSRFDPPTPAAMSATTSRGHLSLPSPGPSHVRMNRAHAALYTGSFHERELTSNAGASSAAALCAAGVVFSAFCADAVRSCVCAAMAFATTSSPGWLGASSGPIPSRLMAGTVMKLWRSGRPLVGGGSNAWPGFTGGGSITSPGFTGGGSNAWPGFTGGGSVTSPGFTGGGSTPGCTDSAGGTTSLGSGASAGGFSSCCCLAPLASLVFPTFAAAFCFCAARAFGCTASVGCTAALLRFAGGFCSLCCCSGAGLFSVELGQQAIAGVADGEGVCKAGEEDAGEEGGGAGLALRQDKIAARPVDAFCGVSHAADPSPLATLKRCTLALAILKNQGSNVRRRAHTVLSK